MRFGYQFADVPDAAQNTLDYNANLVPDANQAAAVEQSQGWDTSSSYTGTSASSPGAISASDWFGLGRQVVTGVVDIFGRPVAPAVQPAQPGMPLWGWAIIGVGGVVALGAIARSMRRKSVSGYRRHRRSRR